MFDPVSFYSKRKLDLFNREPDSHFLFSVSVDRERFDPCSFCVADIDGSRVAFFVLPSREVYFLCILPRSLLHKSPWEVSFRPVSLEKKLYQIHLEFVDTCMLPCWYETKRVTHVEKVTVLPIQGECFSEKYSGPTWETGKVECI